MKCKRSAYNAKIDAKLALANMKMNKAIVLLAGIRVQRDYTDNP
jgi:hypothetical protein